MILLHKKNLYFYLKFYFFNTNVILIMQKYKNILRAYQISDPSIDYKQENIFLLFLVRISNVLF